MEPARTLPHLLLELELYISAAVDLEVWSYSMLSQVLIPLLLQLRAYFEKKKLST